ncbi:MULTISPECIES: YjaG family protein [unclassified Moritella]|uniref:YjaG family protein n=1 Tax=unclassified Moritella TaxID=2637987 RepID=UPI001BA9517B|nr:MULTISPECIES: YjaG family protein [unclassified Moritella]QUM86665.1 YjaG family protein [Moritella sp. 28]QUM90893.1 YjaG family protein [Moritella sp. 36]
MLEANYEQQLTKLLPWQKVSFIASLAERSFPNYKLFSEACETGDAKQFRSSLDLFWESLTVKNSKINFTIQLDRFEPIIPNVDKFDVYGVYPALDACVTLNSAFNSLVGPDPDVNEAINASRVSIGTVASYLEALAGEELDDEVIFAEELMQEELKFQQAVLDLLTVQKSPESMKTLRQFAKNDGISNIGITLD